MRVIPLIILIAVAACDDNPASRTVGASCDRDIDCDERCLGPNGDYPGGFCTLSCRNDFDCPSDTACTDDSGGVCLFTCLDSRDCGFLGPGWSCDQRDAHGASGRVWVCRG